MWYAYVGIPVGAVVTVGMLIWVFLSDTLDELWERGLFSFLAPLVGILAGMLWPITILGSIVTGTCALIDWFEHRPAKPVPPTPETPGQALARMAHEARERARKYDQLGEPGLAEAEREIGRLYADGSRVVDA